MAGEDLDILLRELLGGTGDESSAFLDDARDQIRKAALADGDLRLLLVNGYLKSPFTGAGKLSKKSPRKRFRGL
jgi:hypothetical protein